MDGTAVIEIRSLADEVRSVVEINEKKYIRNGFTLIQPSFPKEVPLTSLAGMIRFAAQKSKNPRRLVILSPRLVCIDEEVSELNTFARVASLDLDLEEFKYGKYMPLDEFRINLIIKFEDSKDRTSLIKYISKITEKSETRLSDDGITINTTVEVGTSGANIELQAFSSELVLKPRRTFPEIEQPETKLLFRMKNKNEMALYDFSDGSWISECTEKLHDFLKGKVQIPII